MEWPDFFVIAPHGTGTRSFLFYLAKTGLPCAPWNAIDIAENPCKAMYFVSSRKQRYRYAGVTIDRAMHNTNLFPGLALRKVPVFQLVRDPVLIMTSAINLGLGENIVNALLANRQNIEAGAMPARILLQNPAACKPDLRAWIFSFLTGMADFLFRFKSQLQSVLRYTDASLIEIFDATELSAKGADYVLSRIRQHFKGGFYGESVHKLFACSFNKFSNTVLHSIPLCFVQKDVESFPIWICPQNLHAFQSQYKSNVCIDKIQIDDITYVIFLEKSNACEKEYAMQKLQENYASLAHLVSNYRYLADIASAWYTTMAVQPEEMTDFLLASPDCLERFRTFLAGELDFVKKLRPELPATWQYTVRCVPEYTD